MTDRKNKMEFSDKTVERAVDAACSYFKTDKKNLEINIITKGSTGLFGLGGRPAKVSVTLKKTAEETEEIKKEIPSETEIKKGVEENAKGSSETVSSKAYTSSQESEPEENNLKECKDAEDGEDDDIHQEEAGKENKRPKADPEEIAAFCERAREITTKILSLSGLEGSVEVEQGDKGPYLDISGEDLALIIGKDGNTLNSLEFLVNLIAKRTDKTFYRVMIEAQGYREKKDQGLRILAGKTAEKVQKTGRSFSMQPMSPRERRVVHMALKGKKGIRTHSSGEGRFRKVVIVPLKRRGPGKNRSRGRRR